ARSTARFDFILIVDQAFKDQVVERVVNHAVFISMAAAAAPPPASRWPGTRFCGLLQSCDRLALPRLRTSVPRTCAIRSPDDPAVAVARAHLERPGSSLDRAPRRSATALALAGSRLHQLRPGPNRAIAPVKCRASGSWRTIGSR